MSWPSPPKLIRNSTPTMLIIAKMSPSRRPTKTDGSAAGSRIFRNCCDARELEAAADVDQHRPRAGQALERLQDHRREPGGEADHHDRRRAAAEDDEEQRIHQHDRRGGERADPRLAGEAQQRGTGRAARRARCRRRRAAGSPTAPPASSARSGAARSPRRRCAESRRAICDGSGTMNAVDDAGADQQLDDARSRRASRRRRTSRAPAREVAATP